MNYTHKNITIAFAESSAKFCATVGSKRIAAPSLQAAIKQVDAALAVKFDPFDALRWYADELAPVRVTRLEKAEYRRGDGRMAFVFRIDNSERKQESLTPDTPENRAAIKKYQDAHRHAEKAKKLIELHVEKLRKAIPLVFAQDYGVKK